MFLKISLNSQDTCDRASFLTKLQLLKKRLWHRCFPVKTPFLQNYSEKRIEGIVWKDKNLLHLQKGFEHKYTNVKNYFNIKDQCLYTDKYRRATHSIYKSKYSLPKEILVVFHDGLNYDYYLSRQKSLKEK